jgi:hypothetical protein
VMRTTDEILDIELHHVEHNVTRMKWTLDVTSMAVAKAGRCTCRSDTDVLFSFQYTPNLTRKYSGVEVV